MKAVVCFSGGQDSTTVLGKALHDGFECYAIGFDYGQRHAVELQQATKIAAKLGVPYRVVDLKEFGKLVTSALVGNQGEVSAPHSRMQAVPNSFVPNRNAMMLTLAHAYAQEVGACSVFGGMCETDYSGYPDCRAEFVQSLERALNIGYQTNIDLIMPLMHRSKGETFALAEHVGVLDLVIEESHTCYEGKRAETSAGTAENGDGFITVDNVHEWGHGCGECPACKLRAKGWEDFQSMRDIAHSGTE